jgi:hemerythrin-like metal-binding protein
MAKIHLTRLLVFQFFGGGIMGTYLSWKPYYSVGDPALDKEHQQIINMIDILFASIQAGQGNAKIESILDQLDCYALTHFTHEEEAMQACGYPLNETHKLLHESMKQRVLVLRKCKGSLAEQELLTFLKNWWTNHIQLEDKQYAPYLEPVGQNR